MKKHKRKSKHRREPDNAFVKLGTAIGVGLLSGLAGTIAITLSQTIEMKITGRKPSNVPADAVAKTLDIAPTDESAKPKLSQQVHWTYGAGQGISRGLMGLAGLRGWPATLAHFTTVWAGSLLMLPALDLAPSVTKQQPKKVLIDGLHHAVYAVVAGLAYDAMMFRGRRRGWFAMW